MQRIGGLNARRMDQVGLKRLEPCPAGASGAGGLKPRLAQEWGFGKWVTHVETNPRGYQKDSVPPVQMNVQNVFVVGTGSFAGQEFARF